MPVTSSIQIVLLGAIWGSSFLFMRVAAAPFGPATLIGIRLGLAALMLAGVALIMRRSLPWQKNGRHYFMIGAINSALPFFLFAYAAQRLPASLLSLFNSLAPIFGALVAALWLGTPLTRRVALGLACGVVGVAVLAFEHLGGSQFRGEGFVLGLSFSAALVAPVLYGVAATYIKRHSAGADAFGNAHGSMWAASILSMPFAISFAPIVPPPTIAWGAAIALGFVCTGAAYLLQFRLIADLGPTKALAVAFLIPVFGVLWGVLLLHEPLGVSLLVGGALIVFGMYLTVVNPQVAAPLSRLR